MYITINGAENGKPFTLQETIDNSSGKLKIGLKSISTWIGWYNIYEQQTVRWGVVGRESQDLTIPAGLYNFSELSDILTSGIENFTLTVNRANGLIVANIPATIQIWFPDPIRYLLGLDDEGWLETGEYLGDRAIEFNPKRILIYLRQVSTTDNKSNERSIVVGSQLFGIIRPTSQPFGRSFTVDYENPRFRLLQSGILNELDFDFKLEWGNGVRHKLNNHSQPIDLVLEIK
jgi:hypothetical protein